MSPLMDPASSCCALMPRSTRLPLTLETWMGPSMLVSVICTLPEIDFAERRRPAFSTVTLPLTDSAESSLATPLAEMEPAMECARTRTPAGTVMLYWTSTSELRRFCRRPPSPRGYRALTSTRLGRSVISTCTSWSSSCASASEAALAVLVISIVASAPEPCCTMMSPEILATSSSPSVSRRTVRDVRSVCVTCPRCSGRDSPVV